MFRSLLVIFRPSGKTDPRAIYISMYFGNPNAYRLCYMNVKYMKFVYIGIRVAV